MEKNNKQKITFIFPTKNRVNKAINFVQKHLVLLKQVNPNFLIIASNVKEKRIFKNKFINKKNIRIIMQQKSGFMNACFEGSKYVKTKFCTFLYDDDELSPYSTKIFKRVFDENLALGHGLVTNTYNRIKFMPISIKKISYKTILLGYFGKKINGVKFMPVSPICLVFETSFLQKWQYIITKFCKNNKLRTDLIINQNIGPDLMLYLHQVIKKNMISFSTPHIARFVTHNSSMSYILGKNKLRIGYWLAKKSLIDFNKIKDKRLNNYIFTFLTLSGIQILIINFYLNIFNKQNYFKPFMIELNNLKKNKNFSFSFICLIKIIFYRFF